MGRTAKPETIEAPVSEVARESSAACPIYDIRDLHERQLGSPPGAIGVTVEELLRLCATADPSENPSGWVMCTAGVRSREAVQKLRKEGFGQFSSVAGGFRAWSKAGLEVDYPAGLDASQAERYARHLVMPQVGAEGQRKLLDARILLAGLGGLNSPVAMYLAAAGVGKLGLLDFDTVERSNLQRQVLHGESRIGQLKSESARKRLQDINPGVDTEVLNFEVTSDNAGDLVRRWDIVVDGTDNFDSRYALNAACIEHQKPLVYGAVMRFQGQVSVFWPSAGQPATPLPCFRCLMPQEPAAGEAPGCAEAGVLGILPGIIGTLQANEALKIVLGAGQVLLDELLMVDALNLAFHKMKVPANPRCTDCGSQPPG
jgi:molybdopterin/thiamine biosynthesis adenylyltransferase/rhodanese-related sulfurtransferase